MTPRWQQAPNPGQCGWVELSCLCVPLLSTRLVVQRRPEPDALMQAVADRFEIYLIEALNQHPFKPLGLATGRTMEPLYRELVQRLRQWPAQRLDLLRRHWISFNLDEYVGLTSSDPRSFACYMQSQLGEPLGLTADQLRLPDGMARDPAEEALRYRADLRLAGGIGLQLLGLGANGHVGFNEPPSASDAPCRVVTLQPATRMQNAGAFDGDPASVPAQAITLGIDDILSADEIHLIVTGAAKAEMLHMALLEPCRDVVPASWLQRHPRVHLWVDDAASAHLPCS